VRGSGVRGGWRDDPEIADTVLGLSPFEGESWEGRERQVYRYRARRSPR